MVTLVAVALFFLVGVMIAALCPATLLALLFGCVGATTLTLPATIQAVRTQVCAARRDVLTATAPALDLSECRHWTQFGHSLGAKPNKEIRRRVMI